MTDRYAAVALAALVVLAGCGLPVGDGPNEAVSESPSTAGSDDAIAVRNGSLPADPTGVFGRLQRVLGTDVEPPASVVVASAGNGSAPLVGAAPSRFWTFVGVTARQPVEPVPTVENGYTTALGNVVLYPGESPTEAATARLLAHEFVHYVQFRTNGTTAVRRAVDPSTTDGRFVTRAVLEGAAVHAADAYVERYLPETRPNSALYPSVRAAYPPGSYQRYVTAGYVEGTEYVAERVDSPANLSAVYERPPTTSEQVIHGLSPDAEPARPLSVDVRADGSPFAAVGQDTMGEAFVRTMLAGGVNESAAAAAAAGWGNDRRIVVRSNDSVGYAWALRWDAPADAREFRNAAVRTLTDLPGIGSVRIETVGRGTVVLLLGDEAFVRGATVSGDPGDVVVTVE